jgi:ubiquinone/menaquinone biosynthesis C-methylase UbiE
MNEFIAVERSDQFWDVNMRDPEALADLHRSTGYADHPQRVAFRAFLKENEIESVLDCGAGPGWELDGLERELPQVRYEALEVTEMFAAALEAREVPVCRAGIEAIPFADESFDVVYQRHVLEHVEHLDVAIREMVRVARVAVFLSMNKRPAPRTVRRKPQGLWTNVYSRPDMVAAMNLPRVRKIERDELLNTWVLWL